MEDEAAPVTLSSEDHIQHFPEPRATPATTIAPVSDGSSGAAQFTSPTKDAAAEAGEEEDEKSEEVEGGDARGMARMVEVELRKQLDVERANSERQIGELQQQLREQQQMLVQILAKLER
jgi:hypothetical protein